MTMLFSVLTSSVAFMPSPKLAMPVVKLCL